MYIVYPMILKMEFENLKSLSKNLINNAKSLEK